MRNTAPAAYVYLADNQKPKPVQGLEDGIIRLRA